MTRAGRRRSRIEDRDPYGDSQLDPDAAGSEDADDVTLGLQFLLCLGWRF